MPQVHINYMAVVVSAAVAFLLGGLWYSPLLFAKMWVNAHGYTEDKVKEMQKGATKAYAVSVLCLLLIALAMAALVGYLHLIRMDQGLKLGLLVWGGLAFPLGLMANMYSDKRITTLIIDTAYQLVYMLIMGTVLTVWQ
ncbi:MAG TPA: DUF1761 domain-containing protein [Blastocatellia bacterium]|nr:DUF1761 domain-containing protein [Blastocatellia bacterium]